MYYILEKNRISVEFICNSVLSSPKAQLFESSFSVSKSHYNQSSTFQPGQNPSCHRKNLFLTTILNTTRRCHHLELVQWFCPSPLATLDIDMKAANDSFVQHTNGILYRKINILSPGILSFYWPLTRLGLVEK